VKTFNLPDLGEGLQEAQIVEWHVKPGDHVQVDQPLVSVETAKAIVEIPSPYSGEVIRLLGAAGDTIHTGAPLVCFDRGEQDADAGTVVGRVEVGDQPAQPAPAAIGRAAAAVKALPAVRALARQLNVDLAAVAASGPGGVITAADVQAAASASAGTPAESLRGLRLAMARNMDAARREVAPATIMDDADIEAWPSGSDVTVRLIRALVAGCQAEPGLNAWYDSHSMTRRLIPQIDVGVAIDVDDGLLVAVLRDAAARDAGNLRQGLERLHADAIARTIKPEELRGHSIVLSNFGMIGGRYAIPVVTPPTVAILGAGRARKQLVPVNDAAALRRMLPLSLTFDHRVVTGAEATRFLVAVIADLERAD
jgi:pyruvate dehydrogenase E2 component (dihydrolipoamide acetyltransferase)